MSNFSDLVGEANLFGGGNYSFVPDRFCTPNSAIYFNNGFLQVPEGIYFSGDFTVTAWIYLKSYQPFSRIFEFGNGQENDNVGIGIYKKTPQVCGFTSVGSSYKIVKSSSIINLNEWYFISFVLNSTIGYIYVNGNQEATWSLPIPNNIIRTINYIGKNSWLGFVNADSIYDEIKIYQKALTSSQIMNEYVSINSFDKFSIDLNNVEETTSHIKCLSNFQLSNDVI